MPAPKPWIVETLHLVEKVDGPLFNALTVAAQLLLINSEWPKKGRVVISAKISRDDKVFTLALETPDRVDPKGQ